MDIFGSGKSSPFERVDFSLSSFLNLNDILTLPQTLVVAEVGFGLTRMMFALFFACQIYTHAR